jgi:hypothetical protein
VTALSSAELAGFCSRGLSLDEYELADLPGANVLAVVDGTSRITGAFCDGRLLSGIQW